MRVLVTGGAGFIGSHLVKRLIRAGEDVTVLDNLSTGRQQNLGHYLLDDRMSFVNGDIRDIENVRSCVMNADRVVHLAAIASVPYSIKNPAETHDVNETIASIIRTPNDSDGTYNLGSGRATTINQLVRVLQRILGDEEFKPIYAPARQGDIRHSQADIGKAKRQLGFSPLTSLEEGLERLVSAETNLAVAPVQQRTGVLPSVANGGKY